MGTSWRIIREQTCKLAMYGSNSWGSVVQTGLACALPPPYNVHTHLYLWRPLDVDADARGHHSTAIYVAVHVRQPRATNHLPGSTRNPRYRREKSCAAGYRHPYLFARPRRTRRLARAARR